MVKRTRSGGGLLRIDFPGYSGAKSLEPISWDEFFERFEETNLAFLYQDKTGSGRPSRFNKLVGRETVETGRARKKAVPRRRAKTGTRGELRQTKSAGSGTKKAAGSRTKRATKSPGRKKAAKRGAAGGSRRSR
jgi:hypothetical protein